MGHGHTATTTAHGPWAQDLACSRQDRPRRGRGPHLRRQRDGGQERKGLLDPSLSGQREAQEEGSRALLALRVREMELLSARWEDFDLEAKVWPLDKALTKTTMAIQIPLADPVIEWLKEARSGFRPAVCFPGSPTDQTSSRSGASQPLPSRRAGRIERRTQAAGRPGHRALHRPRHAPRLAFELAQRVEHRVAGLQSPGHAPDPPRAA